MTHTKKLISETVAKEGIEEGELMIHSDRGSPMDEQEACATPR